MGSMRMPKKPWIEGLATLVQSNWFDAGIGSLIALNAIFLGIVAERGILNLNEATTPFYRCGTAFFVAVFSIEVLIRIGAFGVKEWLYGVHRNWHIFDFILVISAWPDLIPPVPVDHGGVQQAPPPDMMFLRMVRLMRLMKLMRVARLASMLGDLRKLITSIVASFSVLFWSMVLLAVILYIFTLVFLQACHGAVSNPNLSPEVKSIIVEQFGSIYRAMITLYLCAFGGESWGEVAANLEHVGEGYYFLFLFFISFMQIAIMNVIMGIFVDTAMKAAEKDRLAAIKDDADELILLKAAIFNIFGQYDATHNGLLTHEELLQSYTHPQMKAFLDHIEVDSNEVDTLWSILGHDNSGHVSISNFVDGCFRMGRNAKSIDILFLDQSQDRLMKALQEVNSTMHSIESGLEALNVSLCEDDARV